MATRESVKLVRAALDETPSGDIILRGSLDPASFSAIKIAPYQRETLSIKQLGSLIKGFTAGGKIPDITIGMRGGGYVERDGAFYLQDDTYVIDGLQRISAAMHCMRTGAQPSPTLGAVVYFNTDEGSEKELFEVLNTQKTKLSPNIMVRNQRDTNQAVSMFFDLCDDRDFALYDRVCWQQNMRRMEVVTSLTVIKVMNILHSRFVASMLSSNWKACCFAFERCTLDGVGRKIMYGNIKEFFRSIDEIWGIKTLAFRAGAPYMKTGFLMCMAKLYGDHENFWDQDRRLKIPRDVINKLKSFPIGDKSVIAMSTGTSPITTSLLSGLLRDHVNSNKRTKRLAPFPEPGLSGKKPSRARVIPQEAA